MLDMNTATNPARLALVNRSLLVRDLGAHTEFCAFTATASGVRVMAHATHTSYSSDLTVSHEEARNVWRSNVAKGYRRAPAFTSNALPWA